MHITKVGGHLGGWGGGGGRGGIKTKEIIGKGTLFKSYEKLLPTDTELKLTHNRPIFIMYIRSIYLSICLSNYPSIYLSIND